MKLIFYLTFVFVLYNDTHPWPWGFVWCDSMRDFTFLHNLHLEICRKLFLLFVRSSLIVRATLQVIYSLITVFTSNLAKSEISVYSISGKENFESSHSIKETSDASVNSTSYEMPVLLNPAKAGFILNPVMWYTSFSYKYKKQFVNTWIKIFKLD